MLKIYKLCYSYPVLKCRELLNRGVLNRRDHCIHHITAKQFVVVPTHSSLNHIEIHK